jgi:pimeloyl-ACP methyl ester carboxylesterase
MRKILPRAIIILGAILLLVLTGCYMQGGPVPEEKHSSVARAWTMQDVDDAVSITMEKIYSPAPTGNGAPPEECNYIHYLRFGLKEIGTTPSDADAIIVLMPGFLGGANSLEGISRQLVYMAWKQRNKHIEVWVVDRRANNIEDLAGMNAAEEAHDTNVAIDYYYNGAEIDGHKFQGFLTSGDVPYLSEFGLELAMKDVYTVITTNVPDPAVRRQKVFVGGHSLGGPLTAYFAGWDFDGDPATLDDAGYMNCAGLIGLDTIVSPDLNFAEVNLSDLLADAPMSPEEEYYNYVVNVFRTGEQPRFVTLPVMGTETLALNELMAMEAAWHPDDESTLLDRVPYGDQTRFDLQCLHCGSLDNFLFHVPSIKDFRYTNEAQLGVMVDDNFNPMTALQVSAGFLNGGSVVKKQFPLPEDLASLPALQLVRAAFDMDGQFIANDAGPSLFQLGNGPLYTWANFDEIGDNNDLDYKSTDGSLTYTTAIEEVSDIQDVARFLYKGPTNATEWYFPLRFVADMQAALAPWGTKYGLNFLHGDKVAGCPLIDFVASKGPLSGMLDKLPSFVRILEGYNHLDVCVAAPDRPSRRPNELIGPIMDFVLGSD